MKVLGKRTNIDRDGTILFRLFDLTIPSSIPNKLIVLRDGCKYLRLDCFQDDCLAFSNSFYSNLKV